MDNENDPFELITVDGASNEVNEIAASLRSVTLDLEDAIDDDNSRIKENIEENKTENEVQNKNVGDAIDNDKFESLKQRVDSLESPFIWNLKRETQVDIISKTIEKMKEVKDDDMFQWRHFTLSLVLCFEYYRQGEISTAWEKLCECEKSINSIDSKGMYEEFYQSTMDALLHVVLACKCHLLIKEGKLSELEGVLEKIVKADNMDQSCRAALCGIKAAVSMEYGHEGTKNAFDYAKKASELEESEAEWHFLIGKCHGRIRRVEYYNEIPKPEELKSLERAVQLRESPSYIIFLAQSYRETGFRVYSHNKQEVDQALRTKIDAMNKRSEELYRKALKLRPTCAHVNVRCAQGFLKLSHPYKNITKAKECALKAEELAPQNAMTSHVLGNIYEGEKNYEKAREYYTNSGKQGAYGAYMDLLKMELRKDASFNPLPILENMLDCFKETPRHEETLCQLGSYYFFIKNDLVTAYTKYWGKVIQECQDSDKLKTHKSIFLLNLKAPQNIYELLYSEAQYLLKSEAVKTNDKLKKTCREIIIKCWEINSDLDQIPEQSMRNMILQGISKSQSIGRGRGRGGRGRGRGAGRGRGRGDTRSQNPSKERRSEYRGKSKSRDSSNDSRQSQERSCRSDWRSRESRRQSPGNGTKERNNRSDWRSSRHYGSSSRDSSVDSSDGKCCSKGRNRQMTCRCSCGGDRRDWQHGCRGWSGRSDSTSSVEKDDFFCREDRGWRRDNICCRRCSCNCYREERRDDRSDWRRDGHSRCDRDYGRSCSSNFGDRPHEIRERMGINPRDQETRTGRAMKDNCSHSNRSKSKQRGK